MPKAILDLGTRFLWKSSELEQALIKPFKGKVERIKSQKINNLAFHENLKI